MPGPSAIGALKRRTYTPRPVTPPQDTFDVDQLLADTQAFLGELPEGSGTPERRADLAQQLATMEAGEYRRAHAKDPNDWKSNVGVVGAIADSAATPIRIVSSFGGPGAAFIGEGVAQALEGIAHLDGKPLAPGGSTLGDATKSIGKAATATAFGGLNAIAGPMSALASRLGKTTAQKLGLGAVGGAIEGGATNVAQGMLTRGFDAGSVNAAFDKNGMLLDAGLGVGIGAPTGAAMTALGGRAARAAADAFQGTTGPRPMHSTVDANGRTVVHDAPYWQERETEAFQRNQANPGGNTRLPGPNGGTVRGPAPRSRMPAQGVTAYGGPTEAHGPEYPLDTQMATPNPQPPLEVPAPGAVSEPTVWDVLQDIRAQEDPTQPSAVADILAEIQDPAGMYPEAPAGRFPEAPAGMLPEAPAGRLPEAPSGRLPEAPGGRFPEAPAARYPEAPAGMLPEPPAGRFPEGPAARGPEVPQGRFPAADPTAQGAEPFVPPVAEPPAPTRDEFFAAMDEVAARPVEAPPEPTPGAPVAQPFDIAVPAAMQKAMSNPLFGTPVRVTYDGNQVQVHYREKPGAPTAMPLDRFRQMFPDLPVPEAPGPSTPNFRGPAAADDPLMAELLEQVRAERAAPPPAEAPAPQAYDPFDGDEDVDIEAMLRLADEQDAAATPQPQEPSVEVLDPDAAPIQNNASGESGASTEAINRQRSLAAQGRTRVMLDRAGRETPIIGADGVDVMPKPGQTHAIRNADGSYEVVQDNGGRIPPRAEPTAARESVPPPAAPDDADVTDLTSFEAQDARLGAAIDKLTREHGADWMSEFARLSDSGELDAYVALAEVEARKAARAAAAPPPRPPQAPAPTAAPAAATPEVDTPRVNGADQVLGEGDMAGTVNQAGKFVPIDDDSWRTLEPPKNKSVVIRRADGTVEVVRANGGKVGKRWNPEMWNTAQEQGRVKAEARAARDAELAAKRQAAAEAKAAKAAAKPQEPAPPAAAPKPAEPVAAAPEPVETVEDLAPAYAPDPENAPRIEPTKFGDQDAVDVTFPRRSDQRMLDALRAYGFMYLRHKGKWSFKIPLDDTTTTTDELMAAADAIYRGEPVEPLAQSRINKASLEKKSAAYHAEEAARAPEVPPANPPQAEAPSAPSATDSTPSSRPSSTASPDSGATPTTATPPPKPRAETSSDASASGTSASKSASGSADSSPSSTAPDGDYEKVAPETIKIDPKAYQFKSGGDSRGRTEKLKGVEEWDPMQGKLSPVLLHRRADGSLYVVDGHQRVGIAQDLKAQGKAVPDLNAIVLDEADGVTVPMARRAGAMVNVMHNTANPMDIARVLREGELSGLEAKRIGRLADEAGEKFKIGRDLAKLDDKAFDYLRESQVDPKFARLVSQYRPELHEPLLQQLDRHKPRTYSEAESILSQAAEMKSAGVQTDMFGNTTVDDSFKELVAFKERVLSTFRTNRRLFGKAGKAADALETAGDTKIDREAAGKVASTAGRAEELWSKFANAQGSHTRKAIQEAFDDYKAGRTSFGKATDRIAAALDADYSGTPPRPGGGGESAGPARAESPDDVTLPGFDEPSSQRGALFDDDAVEAGRSSGDINDAADQVLGAVKRFLGDERGTLNITGTGLEGLEDAFKKNPGAVYAALRTAGGALVGAATSEDDDASMVDNMLAGAALGFAAPKVWRLSKTLAQKAPTLYQSLKETVEQGRLVTSGKLNPVPQVRKAPDATKDISGFAQKFWSPDKVVPDLWKHIEPILEDIRAIDEGRATTVFEPRVARRAKMDEALAALKADARKSRQAGHVRRLAYIEALRDELRNAPTWMEKQVRDLTNGKITPKRVRQANAIATNAIYHNLLGWAVDSGLANMTQALMNIPQIGVKSTVKGIMRAYSKEGRQSLEFLNVRRPMGHDEEKLFHPWVEKYLEASQLPMRLSDSANRRATWAGAMDYAAKRGMSKTEAEDFARTLVGQTQGVAGELGNNPFHRNLGPLKVFTKYPLIWASMIEDIATHPDPRVKMRALGMMTGITAFSAISGVEWMNFFWPRMGGLPGLGASYDVLQHGFGSPDHDFEEHFELGGTEDRVLPRYINKTANILDRFDSHGTEPRDIVGRKGQVLREVSAEEDLASLFGLETTNRAEARQEESDAYEFAQEARREEGIRSRRARRAAGQALSSGDTEAARSAMDALSKRQRRDFLNDRRRTPRERARRQVPLNRRDEYDARFEDQE